MSSYFSRFIKDDGTWARRQDGAPVIQEIREVPQMESKAEQLAGTLVEGVKAFEKKVEEAHTFFNQQLKDGNETVDLVVQHGKVLGAGVARLKAALGGLTNSPPLES